MGEPPRVGRWPDLRPLGLIALAAAMVWSTSLVTHTYESIKVKPAKRNIKVTGSARKRIVSDLIEWTASIEAHAPDRTTAYKQLRADRDRAVAFLVAQGIKDADIQPQSTSFEEEFDVTEELKVLPGTTVPTRIEKKTPKGFVTREAIIVRSTDVPRVERASREITSLLEQGVTIASSDPSYFYTRLGELKVEMLAAAGKDARARASNIIKNAGGAEIGKLIDADMGIININPANSTETSEEGNNDTTAFEKDIITIVHAEFELD
ncbi:MAG: SIMPL domain-containing protein [Proteobacteria bacterium]|nr:SIMPL domain-containing protein [Pseudomonadota bacterium]